MWRSVVWGDESDETGGDGEGCEGYSEFFSVGDEVASGV